MNDVINYIPNFQAICEGYTTKHTATFQALNAPGWDVIDMGPSPHISSSRAWVVVDGRWLVESLNSRRNSSGQYEDPSYQDTIREYQDEADDDPDNVKVLHGTEHTVVLRRNSVLYETLHR